MTLAGGESISLYPVVSNDISSTDTVSCTASSDAIALSRVSLTVTADENGGDETAIATSAWTNGGTYQTGLRATASRPTQDRDVSVTCAGSGTSIEATEVTLYFRVSAVQADEEDEEEEVGPTTVRYTFTINLATGPCC